MNLTAPSEVKKICEENNIRLSKKKGQNFLIDRNILDKIVKAADLKKFDTVLEVGPGLGTLTIELAKKVKKVTAVEIDQNIADVLKQNLEGLENVEVVVGDILDQNLELRIKNLEYKVVANIPYQITSKVIRQFLEAENKPTEMTLMVQKEVGDRIMATDKKESLLSISVKYYCDPKILFTVSKNCFFPKPKVDSAIIKLANIRERKDVEAKKFFKIVKAGFLHKRRQLAVNLSKELKIDKKKIEKIFEKNSLDLKVRAEDLNLENWILLVNNL